MRTYTRLLDVLDRAESGPMIEESKWDMNLVPKTVARLLAEYDIKMKPVNESVVLQDDALADRLFAAGLKMAEELGVYCSSTNCRIIFSRDEILNALEVAPVEVTLGDGNDKHTERKRKVEDSLFPTIKGGGVGTLLPEDLYLPITQSYVQEPLIDAVINCTLESVYGREIRSRSPWEILAGWHEVELSKAAAKRAGRPGIPLGVIENAVSELGEISATSYGGASLNDWHHIAMISEFKTDYMALAKLTHLVRSGSIIHSFYNTIYGGSCGGRDGMALAIVGGCILLQMAYMTNTHSVSPAHPFFGNNTTPEILQAVGLSQQALARNSRLLTDVVITPVSGPGTKTLLYEVAAESITATVSGACGLIGPRSGAGVNKGHVSGLEARFNAEVARAASGMTRKEGDELVKKLVALYKPILDQRPKGLPFSELYDVTTIKPLPAWLQLYEQVKGELKEMGLPLR
ncbi:MAG: monomethylamine:corrinoid methyltransferase [Anaerolineaceae bacterium]|nr:monomethylamine:corrinoid methyltransferase [Anaerolineaceae bacterium]